MYAKFVAITCKFRVTAMIVVADLQNVFNTQYLYTFILYVNTTFFPGTTAPSGSGPYHCRGFTITLRLTTVGKTPLDE